LQLQQHQSELDAGGIAVAVVTFEAHWIAEAYARETQLPWPLLLDPERRLYNAYGLVQGTATQVLGPGSWWEYMKILARGRKLHRPTGDIYQLGGDVLVDPAGIIRLHYVSTTSVDRPELADILAAAR
jgi:hypothetical protein